MDPASPAQVCVGIDVAQDALAVALAPGGEAWAGANDAAGRAALVARLRGLTPQLVVLEATGGLERSRKQAAPSAA